MRILNAVAGLALMIAAGVCLVAGLQSGDRMPSADDLPEEIVLISLLVPTGDEGRKNLESPTTRFHGFSEIGRARFTAIEDRRALFGALQDGIKNHDPSTTKCFDPRHAVSLRSGANSVDYVICFACGNYLLIRNGAQKGINTFDRSARDTFNRFLKREGVPLSPGAEKDR